MTFAAGMAAGLLLAGAVALYITQSPLPFVDKGLRKASPLPAKTAKPGADADGALAAAKEFLGVDESSLGSAEGESVEPAGTTYFLQVAAFKSSAEADQMRARLAILGYEATISEIRKDGTVFYRVRLGPFLSFDELNRSKTSLSDNGLEATVVRVLPSSNKPQ
ncbi:MAG: SPOR domain-containing protein [Burkholderiaceae bacterium]